MRCPVCRADNNTEPTCRRCRADLGLLVSLEKTRSRLLQDAQDHLRRGQPQAAMLPLERAANLRHGTDVTRLLALAHLLSGDYSHALNLSVTSE